MAEELKVDLTVEVGPQTFKNPLIAASGTFGFGEEMQTFMDISRLGGISTKGFTPKPRAGNPSPRVAECKAGMLNSVGLQNPGLDYVIRHELPLMQRAGATIIANVAGDSLEDYVMMCEALQNSPVKCIELNLSCPNVKNGCIVFGTDPNMIEILTRACVEVSRIPLWVKLTPNVGSVSACAAAAKRGGAAAVSLINTLLGMAVDLETRRPVLRNNTGGYSGPGIKPVALRMVNEVYRSVDIPIVGMGGISTAEDVLEFIMAGASAVQIGTATLIDPMVFERVLADLPLVMFRYGIRSLKELRGSLKLWD